MLDFSSITPQLQIKIAEKIIYFDQKELELSSNIGKNVVKFAKHKIVLPVHQLEMTENDLFFCIETPNKAGELVVKWSQLRELPEIPRLNVLELFNYRSYPMHFMAELGERGIICNNKVTMVTEWWLHDIPIEMFQKLMEVFNITALYTQMCGIDPKVLSLPMFERIEDLDIITTDIPDELLLKIKATTISFQEGNFMRAASIANLFMQQWNSKTRNIHLLKIMKSGELAGRKELLDTMFMGLNFRKHETSQSSLKFKQKKKGRTEEMFEKPDVYSIDRGDKTLLVIVDEHRKIITAEECTDINDIIQS